MRRLILYIAIIKASLNICYSQNHIYSPDNLQECFQQLDSTLSQETRIKIKDLTEQRLMKTNPLTEDLLEEYNYYNDCGLNKYLIDNELDYGERYEFLLLTYHRYLNKDSLRKDQLFEYYKNKRQAENQECIETQKKAYIDKIYIPKNIEECFKELDKELSKREKSTIKNLKSANETIQYHHGLGTWIRNRWNLWGCSRLAKYFEDKEVNHPDTMSGVILRLYYDWLNDNHNKWQDFEKTNNNALIIIYN